MTTIYERTDRKQRQAQEAAAMECRATRHWMSRQASAPSDWVPTDLYVGARYVIHLQCYRCETWRHVAIDHIGTLLASRYVYPDWYLRKGEGRLSGEELRLWQGKQAQQAQRAERAGRKR